MNDIESIISRLEDVAEQLNDVAMSILTEAIESGATTRPAQEKRVSQARRAVEKAIQHLKHD